VPEHDLGVYTAADAAADDRGAGAASEREWRVAGGTCETISTDTGLDVNFDPPWV
jgi:hypothetical protein